MSRAETRVPARPDGPERCVRAVTRGTGSIASPPFLSGGEPMEQTLEHTESDEVVAEADEVAEEELLVEEISIDGMCGVY